MATPSNIPEHLEPSKLGTKEYWNNLYTNELQNNTQDPSDKGTVWFDDSDAESNILSFLSSHPVLSNRSSTSFLDVGCGNGSLLFALCCSDDSDSDGSDVDDDVDYNEHYPSSSSSSGPWSGRMLGVDYSPQSISLARQIHSSTHSDHPNISFQEWDLLNGPLTTPLGPSSDMLFDCVLDKGTFDAISLSEELDSQGRRIVEGYRSRILELVRKGGYFLVTSCNWTEPELKAWFELEGGFVMDGRVEYPTFSFGGVKGQTITTLCFRKV